MVRRFGERPALGALLALSLLGFVAGCAEASTPFAADTSDAFSDATGGECGTNSCEPGTSRCAGPKSFVRCERGSSGCYVFTTVQDCTDGKICEKGECVEPSQCEDSDGDGYGTGCAKGPDCDDGNAKIHPGAKEVCGDKIDNNCKDGADEGCTPQCANQPCVPGETRCAQGGKVEVCERNNSGCGTWSGPRSCPSGTCQNGQCSNCTDNDNDGYGPNCPAGSDCNDNAPGINPGANESCNNKDDDCDGDTDETFSKLGSSCTVGTGACERSGTYVCDSAGATTTCDASPGSGSTEKCGDSIDNNCDGNTDEGFGAIGSSCQRSSGGCTSTGTLRCDPNDPTTTYCDAPNPTGGTEVCDGKDNDCDGQTDEGSVCSSCTDDPHEENDSQSTATGLKSAKTIKDLRMCGACNSGFDADWFTLGNQTRGSGVTIELTQPLGTTPNGKSYANLEIEMYCDGHICDSIRGRSSPMTGTFDGTCSGSQPNCSSSTTWTFYVYPRCKDSPDGNPTVGTPYDITRK